jgi:ADP-heptose:LPS heptosyltransferase
MLRSDLGAFDRLILIRPGALGDTLLLLPALALTRRQWPEAEITLVAREDVARLALVARLADHVSPYESVHWLPLFVEGPPASDSAHELRRILTGSVVVAWISDADGIVSRNLYHLGAKVAVLARGRPDSNVVEHMAVTLARGLEPLGLKAPSSLEDLSAIMPQLTGTDRDLTRLEALQHTFVSSYQRVVAFHVGSGGASKRWPPSRFATLIERSASCGMTPVLIAGPQDEESIQAVLAACTTVSHLPVVRDLSLGELGALLGRVAAYVGNDSGVTHLAALYGAPTLALFGPSNPIHWAPLGRRVRVLRSPTGKMADMSEASAWEALRTLLHAKR